MVVNGGRNLNLVSSYKNNSDVINVSAMAGKAVLICQQNSHPFLDRTLNLEQPVKIGRSVARARAAQNNGIFDCKVLSRNHALFWYANGKFFLQDTKSSNGTFVNNQRLSKSGEESSPREVCSGDIVQFGVDVLENSRKVTHGCIVANLKLYLPDGKEAKASPSTAVLSNVGRVPVEDLYQLNQHIQEALQREQMLQTKLASLQQLVMSLQQASDLSWKALIAEDRLLSRVETLETQLQTYSKNFAEDKLREELRKLNEDKISYQTTSKECLKKILEEKLEATQKCEDIKLTLMNTEAECANFKELMEQSLVELKELALKHGTQLLKTEELQNKLQSTEEEMKEMIGRLESDNEELNNEVQKLLGNEAVLQERLQKLEAADEIDEQPYKHHFQSRSFLEGLDSKREYSSDIYLPLRMSYANREIGGMSNYFQIIDDERQEDPTDVNSKIDFLCTKLAKSFQDHQKTKEIVDIMAAQLQLLQDEKCTKLQRINALEYELEIHSLQLRGYRDDNRVLEQKLDVLEQRLEMEGSTMLENSQKAETTLIPLTIEAAEQGEEKVVNGPSKEKLRSLQKQISELKELLSEAREKAELSEEKVKALQIDLDVAKNSLSETTENLTCTKEKLQEAQKIREEKEMTVAVLKQQMKSLEESLMETTHNSINKQEEEAVQLKDLLSETQLAAKQYKNELELVKERLRVLTEECEEKPNEETSENWDNHLDNRTIEDYEALKQQCETLKETIQELDSQLLSCKTEARLKVEQLAAEFKQELDQARVTAELLQLGLKMESSEGSGSSVTASILKASSTRLKAELLELDSKIELSEGSESSVATSEAASVMFKELEEELVLVKEQYMTCNAENTRLQKQFTSMRQYHEGARQSSFYDAVFVVPLVILIISFIIIFYPTLSFAFGTTDKAQP